LASGTLSDVRRLDPNDRRAPYQQVADAVRTGIRAGTLEPLRETSEVPVGTAKSAIAPRREEGLVVIRHGKGSFVRTELPDIGTGVGDGLGMGWPKYSEPRDSSPAGWMPSSDD
jgi:hypothetical protein